MLTFAQQLRTPELLYGCAQQMGLQPSWITPNAMFAVSVNGNEKYINFAHSPLNSHTSASLAKDKYLTRLILERHNMPNIPFARPRTLQEAEAFLAKYKKIIAKPVKGAGARDIHIVTDGALFQTLSVEKYILEKYIAGQEVRYLVLNGAVIGVYQSNYGTSVKVTRQLQCVSHAQATWDPELVASSIQTARILDLKFAAVDYLVTASGRAYILEVNATPDLKWFHAPTSGPVVDVARHFLEAIFEERPLIIPTIEPLLGVQSTPAYT